MPATLVWGKDFAFQQTALSTGGVYDELFGVDGGMEPISWSSVREMQARAAKHGVTEDLWPVYPDCEVDTSVPLNDARAKTLELWVALEGVPEYVVASDYWLSIILRLLRKENVFFVMV